MSNQLNESPGTPVPDHQVPDFRSPEHTADSKETAFTDTVREFSPWFHRIVQSKFIQSPHCSREDAQDAVQDALLRAWRTLPNFEAEEEGSLLHWLSRITTTTALNHLRDTRRRHHYLPLQEPLRPSETTLSVYNDGPDHPSISLTPTPNSDPIEQLWFKEVLGLLSQLPESQTRLLALATANASSAEIAKEFNISPGAAKVRVARARKAARKLLAEQMGQEIFHEM